MQGSVLHIVSIRVLNLTTVTHTFWDIQVMSNIFKARHELDSSIFILTLFVLNLTTDSYTFRDMQGRRQGRRLGSLWEGDDNFLHMIFLMCYLWWRFLLGTKGRIDWGFGVGASVST